MKYKCPACNAKFKANDGRILCELPAHVAEAYPVTPHCATGNFHLKNTVTDDLEKIMKTYANAPFISRNFYRKLNLQYTRKVETYFSKKPSIPFLSINVFTGGIFPPTGDSIRQYFLASEKSPLTPYGYSNWERYKREMQSVNLEKDDMAALDWTFQTVKNYKMPGAKAVFTHIKGK